VQRPADQRLAAAADSGTAPGDPSPAPHSGFGVLSAPRTIVFGAGQRLGVAAALRGLGKSILVCTDAHLASEPRVREILESVEEEGLSVSVFDRVEPEAPVETILACVDRVRSDPPDVLLAIGGGSCLDHAKATAVVLTHGGSPSDYYGEGKVPGPVLPVVAMPTTAGTGSEATPVAVLKDSRFARKVAISSPHLIPHTAIVDPELSTTAPPYLTAYSGADALAHCVESFTAIKRDANPRMAHESVFVGSSSFTDHYALAGAELIGRSLERAMEDGSDASARNDVAMAALFGGLALGRGGTAAAHAIQYPVGALTGTPHGVGVALLLPYAMEFNLPMRVGELTRLASALGLSSGTVDEASAGAAIEKVTAILDAVGMPRTLADIGVKRSQLDEIAESTMASTRLVDNNPRRLSIEACRCISEAAFSGDRALLGAWEDL